MLFDVHGGRFAGGADHDDAVRPLLNMEIDQRAERRQVQTAVLMHRRDDCYDTALDHFACHQNKCGILPQYANATKGQCDIKILHHETKAAAMPQGLCGHAFLTQSA